MDYVKFGNTGLDVSRLCLGCMTYGDPNKGTHAWPYVYQVWAYDANDFARVAQGQSQPWGLRPYAVWQLPLPYPYANYSGLAATYDPATGRIFLSQMRSDGVQPVPDPGSEEVSDHDQDARHRRRHQSVLKGRCPLLVLE